MHPIAVKANNLIEELSVMFPERRKPLEAMVLSIFAKQHFYALGVPGTGKSALVTTLFSAFEGARTFEALLSKNRPGEALLGPYSLRRMREEDVLVRRVEGYLPAVEFAFLDELGKMSPTTGHDILSILNERKLHQVDPDTGQSWLDVPLYTCGAASNEVPTDGDNTDAAALWDRIVVRLVVEVIQETHNWLQMMHGTIGKPNTVLDWLEVKAVIDSVVPAIPVPPVVDDKLVAVREAMRAADLSVSDRRWKQSIPLLQASAFLAGRDKVEVQDVTVLRHTLWEDPADLNTVERLTIGVADPLARKALDLLDLAEEIYAEVRNSKDLAGKAAIAVELSGRLNVLGKDNADVLAEAEAKGANTGKIKEVADRIKAIKLSVYTDLMGMDENLVNLNAI